MRQKLSRVFLVMLLVKKVERNKIVLTMNSSIIGCCKILYPLSRDCIQILKEKKKALSTVCQLHLKIVETCIDSERPPSFNVFSFED